MSLHFETDYFRSYTENNRPGSDGLTYGVSRDISSDAGEDSNAGYHTVASTFPELSPTVEGILGEHASNMSFLTGLATYDKRAFTSTISKASPGAHENFSPASSHLNHTGAGGQHVPGSVCTKVGGQCTACGSSMGVCDLADFRMEDGVSPVGALPDQGQVWTWQADGNHDDRASQQDRRSAQQTEAHAAKNGRPKPLHKHSSETSTKSSKQRSNTVNRNSRAAHCDAERRYRKNLSDQIEMLRDQLPPSAQGPYMSEDLEDCAHTKSLSKASVVSAAITYIKSLETRHAQVLAKTDLMAKEIVALRSIIRCEDCSLLQHFAQICMDSQVTA